MYQIEQLKTQFQSRTVEGIFLSHTEYQISHYFIFEDRDLRLKYTSLREAFNKVYELNPSTIDNVFSDSRKANKSGFPALIISKLIKNKWFLGTLYFFPDSTLAWKPYKKPLPIRMNTRKMDIEMMIPDNIIFIKQDGLKWNQRFVYNYRSKEKFLLEDSKLHLYIKGLYLSTENTEHTFRHSELFTYPDPVIRWDTSSNWNNIVSIKKERRIK